MYFDKDQRTEFIATAIIAAIVILLGLAFAGPARSETVLWDFGNENCPPCLQMQPTVEQFARETGVKVEHCDTLRSQDVCAFYRVDRTPTYIVMVDGKETGRQVGACSLACLRQLLDRAAPNRTGAVIPRAAPPTLPSAYQVKPQQTAAQQPQQVAQQQQQPAGCNCKARLDSIEASIAALQSAGYVTQAELPKPLADGATQGFVEERMKDVCGIVDERLLKAQEQINGVIENKVVGIKSGVDERLLTIARGVDDRFVGLAGQLDDKLKGVAVGAATSVLGVPAWLAAPIGLIGGPLGVAIGGAAWLGYRKLKRSQSPTSDVAAVGGQQSSSFRKRRTS